MSDFLVGLGMLLALALIVCLPGLVAAPFTGWDDAPAIAGIFWLGLMGLIVFVMFCKAIGEGP